MGSEDIQVKEQWDVVQTMKELDSLRDHVMHFLEHTVQTMSTPRTAMTPFGETVVTDEVEHPMGHFMGVIDRCVAGCFKQYGEDMYNQQVLFEEQFKGSIDG